MKRLLLVAVGALAVLGVFLWRSGDRGGRGAIQDAAPARGAPVDEAEAPLPPVPSEASRAPERAAVVPPEETKVTVPVSAPPPASSGTVGLSLSGTITVVDEQGIEHAETDGKFTLLASRRGMFPRAIEVAVADGRWTARLRGIESADSVDSFAVHVIELDGRPAVLDGDPHQGFELESERSLEIRARWLASILLHVQDRESGRELPAVEVVEVATRNLVSSFQHPGLFVPRAVATGDSPVALGSSNEFRLARVLHARSPGYAWGRIEIDPARPEERFLLLDPGGDLEVTVVGSEPVPGARLVLLDETMISDFGWPTLEAPLGHGTHFEIESIPLGRYRARVEIGERLRDRKVIAEANVDIVAGSRATALLELEDLAPVVLVPLEGMLELPPGWDLESLSLEFSLRDAALRGARAGFRIERSAMHEIEGAPGVLGWNAGGVQPGRYDVEVKGPYFTSVLDVGPSGEHGARIVVPPPCDVSIRCIDEETGIDVDVETVQWNAKSPEGRRVSIAHQADFDRTRARWQFRAPEGEIEFVAWDPHYEDHEETAHVRRGTNELVLRLRPATGALIVLRDGDVEVGWNSEWSASLNPIDPAMDILFQHAGSRLRFGVRDPGAYRLRIGEIPGYEPVPEETLELERGKVLEHVIELQRRR